MKRKLLSVLMALCLILTLLPTAVFAEELTPPEESGEQQEEQIKEPSTPEKEPDDPEKEQEGEEDLQPSDGDPELPAGDGEDERDPQTPEDGVQDPTGEEIPENGSTSVPNEVPLQEIILLEESAVTMEQNGGTTEYDSVSAAIDATQAYNKDTNKGLYTITLNENLAEDVVIPEGRYIKIDLNGHTLTNKESHTIFNKSTRITIVDTSAEKTGVVDNISHGRGAVYNNINAAITLQGGSYTRSQEASTGSDASGSNSWYVLKNFGTMTIKDGVTVKFSDSNSGLYSSLIGNGWQNSSAAEAGSNGEPQPSAGGKQAKLTINGGTFTGGQITVKNDDYGELTITGGNFKQPGESRYAVYNANTATISGGTFTAESTVVGSDYFAGGANTGKLTISKGTFTSESSGTAISMGAGADLTLTGGTFQTQGDGSSYVISLAETATAEISGGSFPGAEAARVVNSSDAFRDGYGVVKNPDGSLSVGVKDESAEAVVIARDGSRTNYLTLSAAAKAAPAGSTVQLQKSLVLTSGISTVNYGVTIDLNGYDIDGTAVTSSDGAVALKTNYSSKPVDGVDSTMRLINSVSGQGGTIQAKLPVSVKSGNSTIPLPAEIGAGVTLVVLEGGTDAVKLDSSAYLLYSETAADYIANGGFRVSVGGVDRIYGSYANAVSAAGDNAVVTLLHDYTGSDKIYSGSRSGTLNLAGRTYTYTGSDSIVDVNYENVGLTIQNGTLMGTSPEADGAQVLYSNSSLTLEGVTVDVKGEDIYGIVTNGTHVKNAIALKNSTLNVPNGNGIYFPSTGTVTIENSIINAKYVGVQMCAGSLAVRGAQTAIIVTGRHENKTGDDGVIGDGAAISIVEREGYQDLGTVTIEDGTFKSAESVDAVKAYAFNNANKTEEAWPTAGEVVSVSGGTFSAEVPEALCQDGYVAVKDENGSFVVGKDPAKTFVAQIGDREFTTIQGAIDAAVSGDTVQIKPGTYAEDLTISKKITLLGSGAGEAGTILTGTVSVAADGVTLDGIWFQQTYSEEDSKDQGACKLKTTETGTNLTIQNCIVQRMTGTAIPYGAIVHYGAAEGTLTLKNTELIAPVAGTADEINSASPSVIGVAAWAQTGENIDEAWKLVVTDCTIRTNGFAVFDRWNNATYTNTTFTGLEGVEGLDGIEVKTCYMALNNPHANDVTYDHCTFRNMRSWGMLVAGEELTVTDCTFDGTNQSRAISVAYGTIDKCTITGNTFDLSGSGSGIMFSDAVTETSTITVADNTFKNCSQEGGYCVNNTGAVEGELVAPITVTGSTFIDCANKYLNQVNVEEAAASDTAYVVSGNTETYYETLAEAISSAPVGSAVYLLKDISETVSVSKNISIYTNGHAFSAANIQCAANYYVRQISGGYEVYYSAPSTGSGGSDSDPSYAPILNVGSGGSVKVNPRTPEEGDKVTITPDPDSGYGVDEVIVTDRNGREIDVTANRDGTYTFEQPRGRVTIEVTFARTGENAFFADVPETFWAYDEIVWAYDNGYVNGTTATTFSPNGSITRQQVWMILARLSEKSPANMAEARTWAMDNGISDGTNPGAAVTRQQLVALLYRFAELRNYANGQRADLSAYPDAGSVAGYAVEPLQWSVANGIVGGTSAGTLNPAGTATRAQFAVILYRFWNQVA